ncbi:tRNA adenosine(34) deaminase TadA [Tindallia californiensis]|uniref:tRNA-specific adenosine deaminase n=1 Tax=Tindallia californiensis TaxID=159292 RepID=A0A1H3Q4N5_9FIRM|nr:tRNA adenosine(34) deaminase TadA [Tindallia californiensis]SDZ08131.1 tRNA(adenine34) deaminase [Tindallia californiensis]
MTHQTTDEIYMQLALREAKKAAAIGEVPIGAVIVRKGVVIASAHNQRETGKDATAHAELIAIQKACQKVGGWRLTDTTLYVTIEPCPMCAGAILQSRIDKVVIGAMDPKAGAAGSLMNILQDHRFNHQVQLTTGVLEEACSEAMKAFFQELREKRRMQKETAIINQKNA